MCARSNGSSTRIDFRPVERWLDQPERWSDPSAAEVVADGNGVTQVDVYVETDDWRFQKAGYALRIRSLGRRRGAEATLKALNPASVGASGSRGRLEVSERLEGADMQTLQRADGPVGRRVRALRGTKRLLPLLEVRTRRRTFVLTAAGCAIGEVAFDETTIRPQGGGPPVRSAAGRGRGADGRDADIRAIRSRVARRMRVAAGGSQQVRGRASVP